MSEHQAWDEQREQRLLNELRTPGLTTKEIRERLLIERYLKVTSTTDKPMLRDVLHVLTHPQVLPLLKRYLAEVDSEDCAP